MTAARHEDLLKALRRATGPMDGESLGAELQVSARSVRSYVRQLNDRWGDLIRTGRSGYQLNPAVYRRYRSHANERTRTVETPQQRLYFLVRRLVRHQEGTRIDRLADLLSVSVETIESDLARARELLKVHDLRIRRVQDTVTIEGSERSKRRLVRQVMLDSADGANPAALAAFEADYRDLDVRALRRRVRTTLTDAGADLNEYVLNDLVIHLVIAADRARRGHMLDPQPANPTPYGQGEEFLGLLTVAVRDVLGIELPPSEHDNLRDIVASRLGPRGADDVVAPEMLVLVRDTMAVVSDYYLLELGDESTITSLAMHVQMLVARAGHGRSLHNPLGSSFRTMHPLVHELALLFATTIEARTRLTVGDGEVDFLAFHLGALFQRQLDRGPLLTVTCVAPSYHDSHLDLSDRLGEALAGQAVVEKLVTTLDHDWEAIRSDLVVSTIDLGSVTSVPVVQVGPFLTDGDLDRVRRGVHAERTRLAKHRLRTSIASILDPRLFRRVESCPSREAALTMMCTAMADAGYVEGDFLEDVLDRERRSSTAFGPLFAVPHSLYLDAAGTGIGVLVSDRPIPWGDVPVRLVILLAVSADQRRVFRDVLDRLIAVLNEPAGVRLLLENADDYDAFVDALFALLDG